MKKVDLLVAPCSHKAARFAVMNWHYSQAMPAGKLVKIGAWEDGAFVGAVIYARGASDAIGKPYGLKQTEVCELVRVALTKHRTPVSKIVSIAQKILLKTSPRLRLVVSYADPEQGHIGVIYQAMNWFYAGQTSQDFVVIDQGGKRWHSRMVSSSGYKKSFGKTRKVIKPTEGKVVKTQGKHKYLFPLDKQMRNKIEKLSQPYPK